MAGRGKRKGDDGNGFADWVKVFLFIEFSCHFILYVCHFRVVIWQRKFQNLRTSIPKN